SQFAYPLGAASRGGRAVWIADNEHQRLVELQVAGSGGGVHLRWVRDVSLEGKYPNLLSVGRFCDEVIFSDSYSLFMATFVDDGDARLRRIGLDDRSLTSQRSD